MDELQKRDKTIFLTVDQARDLESAIIISTNKQVNLEESIGEARRKIEQEFHKAMDTKDLKVFARHTMKMCHLTDQLIELLLMQNSRSRGG
jgi:hypothetical protein